MFHEYREEVSYLKQNDAHFDKIFEEHNELDQKIKNAEQGIIPLSTQEIDVLKKEKLKLKDEVWELLNRYLQEKKA
ncbi:YdcH family protein [Helicobacter sp. 11S02629-2]|uniref:YdcH family protein n=1 Tax=Helicobacter sp. 11S02629-2 TaxID=1476195 RepID=UPI000BA750C8|nr:YdcH family protein [Helicobacter sp. 11S02629-2]PAF45603.1 hypothetical protein BKH40_01605 [Helicobacter sp. 11S02629-2]